MEASRSERRKKQLAVMHKNYGDFSQPLTWTIDNNIQSNKNHTNTWTKKNTNESQRNSIETAHDAHAPIIIHSDNGSSRTIAGIIATRSLAQRVSRASKLLISQVPEFCNAGWLLIDVFHPYSVIFFAKKKSSAK